MHDDYDLRQEQLNKASLMSSKKFLDNLLEKFVSNVVRVSASTSTNLFCWSSRNPAVNQRKPFWFFIDSLLYTLLSSTSLPSL